MSEGFAYIDILFFAMVAAFIALRLRSVLGRRTGHERRRPTGWNPSNANGSGDKVIALPERGKPAIDPDVLFSDIGDGQIRSGLGQIKGADPNFDHTDFVAGAKTAFEMIVEAYSAGDRDALRPLLADDVLGGFVAAIDQREAAGQTLETQLIAVHKAEIVEASLAGRFARVTLRFTSEQVNVVRDEGGTVVEGDPNVADEVVDIWTFERDTANPDPNWTLVETRAP